MMCWIVSIVFFLLLLLWTSCFVDCLQRFWFKVTSVSAGAPHAQILIVYCFCSGSRRLLDHRITCQRVHWRLLISRLYTLFFFFPFFHRSSWCCLFGSFGKKKKAFILVGESRLGLPCRPKTIWLEIDYTVVLNMQFNCVKQCILSPLLSPLPSRI